MALRLAVLKSVFRAYDRAAFPLILFFAALIFLLGKNQKEQRNLLIYEIFGILLLTVPFIGNKVVTFGTGDGRNWSVYGILCAAPLAAYAAVDALRNAGSKREKKILFFGLLLLMQAGWGFSVTGEHLTLPSVNDKISKDAAALAECIDTANAPYVMAPVEVAGDIREYSSEIRVCYQKSYEALQKDLTLLQKEAAYYGCNYIILDAEYDNETLMASGGYENRICTGAYVIYERNLR